MLTTLRNRSVVITGGTKGIGKGIARVFAQLGAKVAVLGRNEADGGATAAELGQGGAVVRYYGADVRHADEVNRAVAAAARDLGGVDILCANAGAMPQATIEKMTEAEWDDIFAINLKGMLFAIQACLPHLRRSAAGRVVLTSSITGPITGFPGWSHYAATKAGMLGFMRTAAIELSKDRITVNAVLPGNIVTEGLSNMGQAYLDSMAASIPLRRLGEVDEIGHAVAFLASDMAAYITGQSLVIDGGQTLPESLAALE